MFMTAGQLSLNLADSSYVLSVGFMIPEDKSVEDLKDKIPELRYNISKVIKNEDGINATLEYVNLEDESNNDILQLRSTAQLYSKGFADGLAFITMLMQQEKEKTSEKSDIII